MLHALAVGLSLTATAPAADASAVHQPVIDVVVTDARGRAIDNLQATDFSVTDQGQPQSIAGARFVRVDGRLFAIFLDEFHTMPGEAADRVREALVQFVTRGLEPGDRVVVFKPLDSILSITLTSDRDAAKRAIESFQPREGDYTPRTAFERNFIAGTRERIDAARTQIAVSALNALASHLGTLDDSRKTLVVVSDGIGRRARTRADAPLPTLDTVRRSADGAHVAVYAVEVNRPADGDAPDLAAHEALRSLAIDTGGRAIAPASDVAAGLQQILDDSRGYYAVTLGVADQRAPRFHAVDVLVRRAGATVRARGGYWILPPEELRWRTTLAQPATVKRLEPPPRISPLIRPWFGMERGAGGSTRVSFVWEPAATVPGDRTKPQLPARVALTVSQPDGTPVFQGVVPAAGGADPSADGRPLAVFELPPGRLRIQMSIQDASSRLLDTDVRDLVVNAFQGPVTLGTAEVFHARNAREFRALADNPDATPVATRQFSRSDRLIVRVPAYAAVGEPLVSARLVTRFGAAMRDLPVGRGPGGERYQIDLPLAALPTGDYAVEVSAVAANVRAQDSIAFRVTP